MGEKTGISWTDSTWNPVRGCSKVSAGCRNCYAETFAERWRGVPGHAFEQGFDLRLVPEALQLPLRWTKPRRIFVNSMSDLFHEDVPESFIREVFWTMSRVPRHTFQVLTKRPARMRSILAGWKRDGLTLREGWGAVLQNVWLGVSVEDQRAANERIPELLATPAAVRFLSCEPLLGPVNLAEVGPLPDGDFLGRALFNHGLHGGEGAGLGWVIIGGESGPGARPCDVAWARHLVSQCQTAGVPVWMKQLGAVPMGVNLMMPRDRAGRDPAEWPEDLRVQQFPEVTRG
jgi:protein gp37